ncbi:hypothetical protein D3C78_1710580 [compost metagenome]
MSLLSKLEVGIEVVNGLSKNTSNVNGVNSPQVIVMFKLYISEQLFDNTLAIIEVTFNRQV